MHIVKGDVSHFSVFLNIIYFQLIEPYKLTTLSSFSDFA